MLNFGTPLSQEQKRLKLRDASRLLIEGEDFDYIRSTVRGAHGSTFSNAELEALADQMAFMPADKFEALINNLRPARRDERHFQASIDSAVAREARIAQAKQKALDAYKARKIRQANDAEEFKTILTFVGVASIALLAEYLLFVGDLETQLIEGLVKASITWAIASFLVRSIRPHRRIWIFLVSISLMAMVNLSPASKILHKDNLTVLGRTLIN